MSLKPTTLESIAPARSAFDEAAGRTVKRRALEAAIWGMPIVSVDAMREAFFRDAGARYNDIVYWSKPSDWKNQLTTPNASSLYVYFNFNIKDGPVVLELPPASGAGLFGTLLDAWQVPLVDIGPKGEDKGRGGKYLLMSPSFKDRMPQGYIPVRCSTYNGYALFRAIPASGSEADVAKAIDLVKQQRLYRLAQASNPPEQRFIDMTGRLFDGIVRYDESFYVRLARMINEERSQPRDMVAMGQLRSIGIHKGEEFAPDGAMQAVLKAAVQEAHNGFVHEVLDPEPWWPGLRWGSLKTIGLARKTGFSFQTRDYLDIDARAPIYFLAFGTPARLGEASFYLVACQDAGGQALEGANSYRLHIPPGVPAEQFWAVTVYDVESAAFIRESPRVGLDSYDQKMKRNADGSVDLYFGAKAAEGRQANWVYTKPGHDWFAMFRFYGPGQALFDKTWIPCDFERLGAAVSDIASVRERFQ